MKYNYTTKEKWELIKLIWRIPLTALLFQFSGGTIAVFIGQYGQPLVDFWFGGAVSTFPGFVIGTLWHLLSSNQKIKNNFLAFNLLAFICLALTIFAFFVPLEEFALHLNKLGL